MNSPQPLNELSHSEIRAWLDRALRAQESLPRLTPDESPHLAILRLEKTLKPAARDSLRDGSVQLVREFCTDARGQIAYVHELLSLVAAFKSAEAVRMLTGLAERFPQLRETPLDVRLAVLATLVDTPPPQAPDFWYSVLRQDPEAYAALALSGVLAVNPTEAVSMLSAMPDIERVGQAAALKLDLAWDDLLPKQRFQFAQNVRAVLPRCGSRFAGPIQAWADSKEQRPVATANAGLYAALAGFLGGDSAPRIRSSRLCACSAA